LQKFLLGLGGRALEILPTERFYTDTEKLFLPEIVDHLEHESDNFAFYKALSAHLWAQTWYGTWRIDAARQLTEGTNDSAAFHYLETIRLNACMARDYPGLWRQMQRINTLTHYQPPQGRPWQEIIHRLSLPQAKVEDSIKILPEIDKQLLPNPFCYQGEIDPDNVQRVKKERLKREKNQFRLALAKVADDLGKLNAEVTGGDLQVEKASDEGPRFSLNPSNQELQQQDMEYDLQLDGISVPIDDASSSLMVSIIQDLGELPPGYLTAASPGNYHASLTASELDDDSSDVWKGTYHEKGAFLYDEWVARATPTAKIGARSASAISIRTMDQHSSLIPCINIAAISNH